MVTDAYPRNAGMASGIYQALKALHLPSGATLYYTSGEWETNGIRAVSAREMDGEVAAAFGDVIALPTYFHAGGDLLEIDRHLSVSLPGTWIFDELVGHEAEWMEQEKLDAGEQRRAELQTAIDESREEGDADTDQLDHAQQALDAAPPWFLLLVDSATRTGRELHAPRAKPQPTPEPHLSPMGEADPTRCSSAPKTTATANTSSPPTYSRDRGDRQALRLEFELTQRQEHFPNLYSGSQLVTSTRLGRGEEHAIPPVLGSSRAASAMSPILPSAAHVASAGLAMYASCLLENTSSQAPSAASSTS